MTITVDLIKDYNEINTTASWTSPRDEEDGDDEFLRPSTSWCTFAATCSIIFSVTGGAGNLITVIAFARCRRLRNAITAFVVSLAIADLIFCTVNLPLTAVRYANQKWILGNEMCAIFPFLFYGNVCVSLLFMTVITLNRFIFINYYHLHDKIFSRANIILMIALCWAGSFLILTPTLLGLWGRFGYKEASFSCTILPSQNGASPKKFFFIVGFLCPVVTIIISYSSIFYKVHQNGKRLKAHEPTLHPKYLRRILTQRKKEMNVTRMMLAIFCTFLVCFLPLMIVNVFEKKIRSPGVHVVASVLAWMSSCINPLIYAVMSRHYREAYLLLFCPRRLASTSQQSSRVSSVDSAASTVLVTDNNIKIKQQTSKF